MTNAPQALDSSGHGGTSALISPVVARSASGLLCGGQLQDGLTALLLEEFDLALPDDVPYLLLQAPLIATHILRYLGAAEKK
jgi:hypothetical protein